MIDTAETLNIKDLVIVEPGKEQALLFDPEREISEEAWREMKDEFVRDKQDLGINRSMSSATLELAVAMKLLAGENPSHIPGIEESAWEKIDDALLRSKIGGDWTNYLGILRGIHLFDPERAKQELYSPNSEVLGEIFDVASGYDVINYFTTMESVKIIKPDMQVDIPQTRWDGLQKAIAENEDMLPANKKSNEKILLPIIANAKLLDPQKIAAMYPLSSQKWSYLKQSLQEIEQSGDSFKWIFYANFAKSLQMLSADRIKVTGKGLELVMPSSKAEINPASNMPEVRNF